MLALLRRLSLRGFLFPSGGGEANEVQQPRLDLCSLCLVNWGHSPEAMAQKVVLCVRQLHMSPSVLTSSPRSP